MSLNTNLPEIIECIPNFSEGKRRQVVSKIEAAILGIAGVKLMRSEMDSDHNRAVMSIIGPPESVVNAVFKAVATARDLIDLTTHRGVHPRIGATDVIPIVPIAGVSLDDCIKWARELGQMIVKNLQIPVYFYEEAATSPDRRNLANIRTGGFEALSQEESIKGRMPDLGGPGIHPTAGAVAIGVRKPLIAFNINLNTDNINIAKKIARTIRERDGGLPAIKALGLRLKGKNIVQVSMNLTDYKTTSLAQVFERVEQEAEKYQVEILESELIGLIDLEAVLSSMSHRFKIKSFDRSRILDLHIQSLITDQSR